MLILSGCATVQMPQPSAQHPLPMCAISCPNARSGVGGFFFRAQHICAGGTRWLLDVLVKGEHTVRGADGEKLIDVWITDQGDYAKVDVERGTCASFIQRTCMASGTCASHPGEVDPKSGNFPAGPP